MVAKNIDAEKFVEENEELRDQIRKLKQKRLQAKLLDFTIRV